ncbi:ATP-binding cassette domain-containing protein [symbiont of Argiope bruennichi]|uniref:ABC transporter ATP-binding protein n=1 Tax=symbiont of Argiope bruennichi TaxID=2810479 RepID=UPI003DA3660A
MLALKNISKRVSEKFSLENINFSVSKGEIIGILGPNGAGKTTLFRILLNLIAQDAGDIYINEDKFIFNKNFSKVGYLPEIRSLLLKLKVFDQICYFSGLKCQTLSKTKIMWDKWAPILNIKKYENTEIRQLSKGNQQKVQFLAAFIHDPEILILDEPFSGLDIINAEIFKKVILQLSKENKIILFSSHKLDDVEKFCEKILIINNGKEILKGKIAEIKKKYQNNFLEIKGLNLPIDEFDAVKEIKIISATKNYLKVKFFNQEQLEAIYKILPKIQNLTFFEIKEPSLTDIFIEKLENQKIFYENQ